MTARLSPRLFPLLAACVVALACPNEGKECPEGLTACANGCVDLRANKQNCGACGVACETAEYCGVQEGGGEPACLCQPGNVACGGTCVSTQSNPDHCGGCNSPCPSGNVCEQGTCRASCSLGADLCNGGCVDFLSDAQNCGGCGQVCPQNAQSCRGGKCTYDLVAACFAPSQTLVGINTQTSALGASASVGGAPQALAQSAGVVLVTDATNQKLRQLLPASFSLTSESHPTASSPNFVLAQDAYVYVVNSFGNTLQIFERGQPSSADAGFPNGLGLTPPQGASGPVELQLGDNTSPQAVAKLGTALYLPLYGGFGTAAAEGGKVVKVDVSDPKNPVQVDAYALPTGASALKSFDGGTALPRPYHIVARNQALYVPLNNLDESYAPAGPGIVVRLRPDTQPVEVTALELPQDACRNAGFVVPVGANLAVGCLGEVTYDSNYNIVGSSHGGVVLLSESDQVVASWSASCPVGLTGCTPASVSRLAVQGNTLYVGDSVKGRVFVLDVVGNSLVERRGFAGDAGSALEVCAPSSGSGNALVSDLVVLP